MNIIPNATRQQMLAKEATITADYVRSILSYDEDTGTLTSTKTLVHNAKAGDIVGCPTTNGYQRLKIRGKHYRTAWPPLSKRADGRSKSTTRSLVVVITVHTSTRCPK